MSVWNALSFVNNLLQYTNCRNEFITVQCTIHTNIYIIRTYYVNYAFYQKQDVFVKTYCYKTQQQLLYYKLWFYILYWKHYSDINIIYSESQIEMSHKDNKFKVRVILCYAATELRLLRNLVDVLIIEPGRSNSVSEHYNILGVDLEMQILLWEFCFSILLS